MIASWIGKGAYTGSFSLGGYYENRINLGNTPSIVSAGLRIADIGAPLTYKEANMSYAVPASVQLGGGLDMAVTADHQINLALGTKYFFLPKEARLLTLGLGGEYGYRNLLFARAGFQYGQRSQSFATMGLGVKYQGFTLDATYRKSTAKDFGVNTVMISLGYSL